ncbi:MAG: hypothetical protein MK028_05465 [Dehalococcoidia bacterium]|nr:hypothetical protein [Chloroflexota bacterium]MCH2525756.1 hypothetical protein [Dehalococcoidia bacterium]|tara:strand:- start:1025 stop:1315 length:291 start_codon:yes stop_codon:yes gene_type:complete
MVGQLRIYTINEGMMDSWLKLFKEEIAPKVIETGMGVETAWISEDRSKFIWIRTYEDIPDIEVKEAAFYGSNWWKQNVDRVRGHLANRDITIIERI